MAQMAYLQDPASASRKMVGELVASGRIPVIQYSGAAQVHDLAAVNALAAEFGTNVQIRFFGWEWKAFDASLLDQLPDVANLSLDTLRTITNLGSLAGLSKLVELRFAVFEHPDGGFLKTLPLDRYTSLGIGENKRRNFDLSPLARAASLERLFVHGHDRNIEAISSLPKLHDVSLSGFPKRHDLAFLNDLKALRSLFLILGSRESIGEFVHPELRKLKLIWVRLLENLGPLGRFPMLEELVIEDQLRLTRLDIAGVNLRSLRVANCKNLERIDPIEKLGKLERFAFRETRLPARYRDYVRAPEN